MSGSNQIPLTAFIIIDILKINQALFLDGLILLIIWYNCYHGIVLWNVNSLTDY